MTAERDPRRDESPLPPPADLFHRVATGPRSRRALLTPVGLVIFGTVLTGVVVGGIVTDRLLGAPALLPGAPGRIVGFLLLAAGVATWGSCVAWFGKARGTPVPFNPPPELVRSGPYAWSRNPMLTGVFATLFGLGFLLHSFSLALLWTPLFVVANFVGLKRVEEPELERRLGDRYREYKRAVPMFLPLALRFGRRRPSRDSGESRETRENRETRETRDEDRGGKRR